MFLHGSEWPYCVTFVLKGVPINIFTWAKLILFDLMIYFHICNINMYFVDTVKSFSVQIASVK